MDTWAFNEQFQQFYLNPSALSLSLSLSPIVKSQAMDAFTSGLDSAEAPEHSRKLVMQHARMSMANPKESKYPNRRVSRTKNHSEYVFWDLKPYYLDTWTLWEHKHWRLQFIAFLSWSPSV